MSWRSELEIWVGGLASKAHLSKTERDPGDHQGPRRPPRWFGNHS